MHGVATPDVRIHTKEPAKIGTVQHSFSIGSCKRLVLTLLQLIVVYNQDKNRELHYLAVKTARGSCTKGAVLADVGSPTTYYTSRPLLLLLCDASSLDCDRHFFDDK